MEDHDLIPEDRAADEQERAFREIVGMPPPIYLDEFEDDEEEV
jgi:hypothetical protein